MKKLIAILLFIGCPLWAAAPPLHTVETGGNSAAGSLDCDFSTLSSTGSLYVSGIYIQSTTSTITSCHDSNSNPYHIIGPYRSSSGTTYLVWMIPTSSGNEFLFNCDVDGHTGATGISSDQECAEYTNMASSSTVLDCNAGSNGNSTALDSTACTPSAANDLIVGFGGVQQNNSTATAGAGFTLELSQAHSTLGDSVGFEDKNITTCTALSAPMTMSVSGQWAMGMAAFKTSAPSACTSSSPPGGTLSIR